MFDTYIMCSLYSSSIHSFDSLTNARAGMVFNRLKPKTLKQNFQAFSGWSFIRDKALHFLLIEQSVYPTNRQKIKKLSCVIAIKLFSLKSVKHGMRYSVCMNDNRKKRKPISGYFRKTKSDKKINGQLKHVECRWARKRVIKILISIHLSVNFPRGTDSVLQAMETFRCILVQVHRSDFKI